MSWPYTVFGARHRHAGGQYLALALRLPHLGECVHDAANEPYHDSTDTGKCDRCVEEHETRESNGELVEGTCEM